MIVYFGPFSERVQQVAGWAVVEAPFALFQEEMEVGFRDAVVTPHMAFCLVPEVLDAVDVVFLGGEGFRMADPVVVEFRDVENVV